VSAPVLRAAGAADAKRLAEIVDAAYGHYVERLGRLPMPMNEDYDEVVRELDVVVAERDGRIVGFVALGSDERGFFVANVAVEPEAQGTGVGRALLGLAEERAREQGFDSIFLWTHELMTENRALYQRIGYVEEDWPDPDPVVYLRKRLNA
jgi:N-acetylglutamate synthase-like GNAT family acetyltransferase